MKRSAANVVSIIREAREREADPLGEPTALPQLQPMYFVRLRRKLELRAARRARLMQLVPVAAFVGIVAIVLALMVQP